MLWRSGHIHTNTEGGFGKGIFLITRPEHEQDSIFSHSIARGMVDSYMWQSHVEIEGYSVAYFDRIEAPYR